MLQRIRNYYKSHLWVQVSAVFGTSILVITLCYQEYMKQQYAGFLLEKNYQTEAAVLDTMKKNMDYSIKEYIDLGAQMAVRPDLYQMAGELFANTENAEKNARDLKLLFSALASYSSNVVNMSLVSLDGEVRQYDKMLRGTSMMWSAKDQKFLSVIYGQLYKAANRVQVPRYLVSALPGKHPTTGERVFHIFYPLIGKEHSFSKMNAMLCVTYRMAILEPLVDVISQDNVSYASGYITDSLGMIIYHSDSRFIGEMEGAYLSDASIVSMEKPLDKLRWKLHISLDKTKMDQNVSALVLQGMVMYICLLAGLVVIFYLIIHKINGPLNAIKSAMLASGLGERKERVPIRGSHEIWEVAKGYNDMIEKLDGKEREVEKNYQLSLISLERQHQAEREALETQINAHFICNTLGTINYEAMEAGNHMVSMLIKKLSNILRYTFDQKCQNVYMCQEIVWIEQYLYLQKARLEDVFQYTVSFEEELSQWPCCKLLLQPFVENAIIHGFEGREEGGKLCICARKESDCLKLSIRDNGCGIPQEKKIRIQEVLDGEHTKSMEDIGIGIQNVASRVRLFYGKNVRMKVRSAEGEGTEFLFWLPMPEENRIPE